MKFCNKMLFFFLLFQNSGSICKTDLNFFGVCLEGKNTCLLTDDGWMTFDFTSILTVFQSYQDDVWMIMKGCVQWNFVYG